MKEYFRILGKKFNGQLGRGSFIFYMVILYVSIFALVYAGMLGMVSLRSDSPESSYLMTGAAFGIYYALAIFLSLITIIASLAITVRRQRSILSSRPASEIYFVFCVFILLGLIIPGLSIAYLIILALLPPAFDKSEFYKNNLLTPIANMTLKVSGFFKATEAK